MDFKSPPASSTGQALTPLYKEGKYIRVSIRGQILQSASIRGFPGTPLLSNLPCRPAPPAPALRFLPIRRPRLSLNLPDEVFYQRNLSPAPRNFYIPYCLRISPAAQPKTFLPYLPLKTLKRIS